METKLIRYIIILLDIYITSAVVYQVDKKCLRKPYTRCVTLIIQRTRTHDIIFGKIPPVTSYNKERYVKKQTTVILSTEE